MCSWGVGVRLGGVGWVTDRQTGAGTSMVACSYAVAHPCFKVCADLLCQWGPERLLGRGRLWDRECSHRWVVFLAGGQRNAGDAAMWVVWPNAAPQSMLACVRRALRVVSVVMAKRVSQFLSDSV